MQKLEKDKEFFKAVEQLRPYFLNKKAWEQEVRDVTDPRKEF